jgi:hypothetical protein
MMSNANYFDGFDALVMRDFVSDVLDAFNFLGRITSVKQFCSTSERFALALELVRIAYELEEVESAPYFAARNFFAEAYRIMLKAKHQFNMTAESFGRFMKTRYDVRAFATAALNTTLDVSTD